MIYLRENKSEKMCDTLSSTNYLYMAIDKNYVSFADTLEHIIELIKDTYDEKSCTFIEYMGTYKLNIFIVDKSIPMYFDSVKNTVGNKYNKDSKKLTKNGNYYNVNLRYGFNI